MSETVQIESFNAEFLTKQKLHDLIFYRKSFDITNVNDISETVKIVEYVIEHQQKKLTCRVYTEYRSTAVAGSLWGTVAKLAMRQPFVLFKGLTFQKLCLPGAFRPGDHHN
ncbi:hypothetical protein QSX59_26065, partial [Escherichia coli]|nr:hypothetical protein [Escherichia coli]MDL8612633.1 hypothetical protein [Escherichia coli]MDL9674506.1 hypothetical protein [Escherichia coli]MDL9689446.1 hypothetical protein [Escherichia coli]